jgi:hypothetical protein
MKCLVINQVVICICETWICIERSSGPGPERTCGLHVYARNLGDTSTLANRIGHAMQPSLVRDRLIEHSWVEYKCFRA